MAKRRLASAVLPGDFLAVLTKEGADYLLRVQLGITAFQRLILRLFTNSHEPARSDNIGSYTECTLPGYLAVELEPWAWSVVPEPEEATYAYPPVLFALGGYAGPQVSIVGFYLTNGDNTLAVWAEAFANPVPVPSMGSTLIVPVVWNDFGGEC